MASIARLIGERLEADYGIDPRPLFAALDIDTSNFARAFKRWTGVSPGEYQKAA